MMALFTFALLLLVGLHSSALTAFNVEDMQKVTDAPTANSCEDCTQIFELIVDLMSHTDIQRKLMDSLEQLCDRLPGPSSVARTCKEEVEKIFPLIIIFFTGAIKPGQVCTVLGLCDSHSYDKQERLLVSYVQEGFKAAMVIQESQPSTQCAFCIFLLKTLEGMLPKERTEGVVVKLLEEVCVVLPSSCRDKCEALIERYGKTLLKALLSYLTPQTICALIHICKGQEEAPLMGSVHFEKLHVQRLQDGPQVQDHVLLPEVCMEDSPLQPTQTLRWQKQKISQRPSAPTDDPGVSTSNCKYYSNCSTSVAFGPITALSHLSYY